MQGCDDVLRHRGGLRACHGAGCCKRAVGVQEESRAMLGALMQRADTTRGGYMLAVGESHDQAVPPLRLLLFAWGSNKQKQLLLHLRPNWAADQHFYLISTLGEGENSKEELSVESVYSLLSPLLTTLPPSSQRTVSFGREQTAFAVPVSKR